MVGELAARLVIDARCLANSGVGAGLGARAGADMAMPYPVVVRNRSARVERRAMDDRARRSRVARPHNLLGEERALPISTMSRRSMSAVSSAFTGDTRPP